jgi:hypothetical protein
MRQGGSPASSGAEVPLRDHRDATTQQVVDDQGHQLEDRDAEAARLLAVGDPERAAECLLVRILLDERQSVPVGKGAGNRRLAGGRRPCDDDQRRHACS